MSNGIAILRNGNKGVDVFYKNQYIGTELPYIVKHYLANFFSYEKGSITLTKESITAAINKVPGISEELRTNYLKVNSLMNSFREIKKLIEDGNVVTINRANKYGMKRWPYDTIEIMVNGTIQYTYSFEGKEFEYFEALFTTETTMEMTETDISKFIESFQLCSNRKVSFEEKILTIAAKAA